MYRYYKQLVQPGPAPIMLPLNLIRKCPFVLAAALSVVTLNQCAGAFTDENFWTVPYAYNEFINGAPGVSVTSPADGDTNISTNHAFIIAFNKVVNSATVTIQAADGACTASLQLSSDGFATCLGGTVFTSDNQLFAFTTGTVLTGNQQYRLRVMDTVADTAGNTMLAPFVLSTGFTTTTNLTVASQVPVSGTTAVATNTTNVTLNFAKSMDTSTLFMQSTDGACVDLGTIRVSNDNFATCLGGTLNTAGNPTIVVTLPSTLSENTMHQVRVTQSARDSTGSGLQAVYTGAFTTFGPSNVGGATLQLWLKADGQSFTDAGSTAAGNGDFVQQWNDASGNANHGIQTTALKKPVLVTNQPAVANKPVMRFDGTPMPNDDVLDFAGLTLNAGTTPFTIFTVMKADAAAVEHSVLSQFDGSGTGRNMLRWVNNCGGSARLGSRLGNIDTCAAINIVANNWYIAAMTWDSTNATMYNLGNAGTPTTPTPENANGAWRLGSSKVNLFPFDGDIAEVIIYSSSLAPADRQTVECYLSYKYGIAVTGHVCP